MAEFKLPEFDIPSVLNDDNDLDTMMIVGRPDGQAWRSQGAKAIGVGALIFARRMLEGRTPMQKIPAGVMLNRLERRQLKAPHPRETAEFNQVTVHEPLEDDTQEGGWIAPMFLEKDADPEESDGGENVNEGDEDPFGRWEQKT